MIGLDGEILPRDVMSRKLSVAKTERGFSHPPRPPHRFTFEESFKLTKIDRRLSTQIKETVDFEEELADNSLRH